MVFTIASEPGPGQAGAGGQLPPRRDGWARTQAGATQTTRGQYRDIVVWKENLYPPYVKLWQFEFFIHDRHTLLEF